RRTAELRAAGETREIFFGPPEVITTGVPRARDTKCIAALKRGEFVASAASADPYKAFAESKLVETKPPPPPLPQPTPEPPAHRHAIACVPRFGAPIPIRATQQKHRSQLYDHRQVAFRL